MCLCLQLWERIYCLCFYLTIPIFFYRSTSPSRPFLFPAILTIYGRSHEGTTCPPLKPHGRDQKRHSLTTKHLGPQQDKVRARPPMYRLYNYTSDRSVFQANYLYLSEQVSHPWAQTQPILGIRIQAEVATAGDPGRLPGSRMREPSRIPPYVIVDRLPVSGLGPSRQVSLYI